MDSEKEHEIQAFQNRRRPPLPQKTFECAEQPDAQWIVQVQSNQKSLQTQMIQGCRIEKPEDTWRNGLGERPRSFRLSP
jgi:hypothetical protein